VREWRLLGAANWETALAFKARREDIVEIARDVLAAEGLLGVWEVDLLDGATVAPLYWNYLAMSKVERALDISEDRACERMPMWHYEREAAKSVARDGRKSPLVVE
jgi:hypothetical protein